MSLYPGTIAFFPMYLLQLPSKPPTWHTDWSQNGGYVRSEGSPNLDSMEVSHLRVDVTLHLSGYPPRLQAFPLLHLSGDASCAGIHPLHRRHSVPTPPGTWQIQVHDGCGCHSGKGRLDNEKKPFILQTVQSQCQPAAFQQF